MGRGRGFWQLEYSSVASAPPRVVVTAWACEMFRTIDGFEPCREQSWDFVREQLSLFKVIFGPLEHRFMDRVCELCRHTFG